MKTINVVISNSAHEALLQMKKRLQLANLSETVDLVALELHQFLKKGGDRISDASLQNDTSKEE